MIYKKILLILLLFINGCSKSYPDGPYENFYRNGKIEVKGTYKNQEKDGLWKYYAKTGHLSKEINFVNNVEQSSIIYDYYKPTLDNLNGSIREKKSYILNNNNDSGAQIKQGEWLSYDKNGQVIRKENYYNNKKNGEWLSYDKNGQVIFKGNYYEDKRDGEWIQYRNDGQVSNKRIFILDEEISNEIHSYYDKPYSNQVETIENYEFQNGRSYSEGPYKEYSKSGQLIKEGNYTSYSTRTYKTGEWRYYRSANLKPPNCSKKWEKYNCRKVVDRDLSDRYYYSGGVSRFEANLLSTTNECDSRVVNMTSDESLKCKDEYEKEVQKNSGQLEKIITYAGGGSTSTKQGKAVYFYENGQIQSSGNYHKNQKDGSWKFYKENGEIDESIRSNYEYKKKPMIITPIY